MKKINPKIITIAMILLTLLISGSFIAKEAIAPSGGGSTGAWEDEYDPDG